MPALFSRVLAAGAITIADIDSVAARIASFHARASKDVPSAAFGSAALLPAQLDAVLASIAVGPAPRRTVGVRILTGAERDAVWTGVVLARVPAFAKYEVKSGGRTMPLAILTPVA